jgi:hypothetical protein
VGAALGPNYNSRRADQVDHSRMTQLDHSRVDHLVVHTSTLVAAAVAAAYDNAGEERGRFRATTRMRMKAVEMALHRQSKDAG